MIIGLRLKNKISGVLESFVNSYSQVFFSDNKIFGVILIIVSFFDFWAGFSGIISVFVTNLIAYYLGYNIFTIKKGSYGFNSLLVGLGVGLTFQPGIELFFIVFFASVLTLFISLFLEGIFAKYYLPFLSIPFLFGMWIVMLSSRDLLGLGLSERGIFTTNELFQIGGKSLVDIYIFIDNIHIPEIISTYFLSLASIFFQYNIFAGLLIAAGLFFYSRISFLLSIIGYFTAYAFYHFIGADITQYGYAYIGFNYILMAIAVGGHFLIPTKKSFLWVILLLPVVVLITLSIGKLLIPYQLAVYSLPFNIVVILFIYILKLR
ncbi:MAG: urea transporter, partial [Bacteroidales bacterium]|nr:urea transporter [Bacteroidales bacterium]